MPDDDDHLPVIPELRPVDSKDTSSRGLQLKEKHFKKIGYTNGCIKCRKMQRNEKSTDGHSPDCRKRALRLLRDCEEFKDEVERAEVRLQEAVAREIERTVSMNAEPRVESPDDSRASAPSSHEELDPSSHDCRNPSVETTAPQEEGSTVSAQRRSRGSDEPPDDEPPSRRRRTDVNRRRER